MPTLLCVPIMVEDEPTALRDAAEARDAGADMVEFRVDSFFSGARSPDGELDEREVRAILRLVRDSALPCIITCRAASEAAPGGEGGYDGDDDARIALYEILGTAGEPDAAASGTGAKRDGARGWHPPRYIDVELATYARSANIRQKIDLAVDHPHQRRLVSTGLILSFHDFTGRPADLMRRIASIAHEPAARVAKVVITARSIRDNLELFDLLGENAAGKPLIALAMGRFGLMSRVLAPKFGGFVTFGALRPGAATAPGQPTVRDLLNTFRFRSINRRTRVFGVIGWPIDHSLSPAVHNAAFEAYAGDSWENDADDPCNAVYLPLPVGPEYEHFKATIDALVEHPRLDFAGCSVTVPHKQHLVRFARERLASGDTRWTIDQLSELCGAANTLVIDRAPGGEYTAARVINTDAPAAAGCLRQALEQLEGKRIALIGAGGVARAVAAGLVAERASVVVLNRSRENADALVRDLHARLPDQPSRDRLSAKDIADFAAVNPDAVVNCTPVGMAGGPAPKASAIERAQLEAWAATRRAREDGSEAIDPVVFDTVYNPLRTPLLAAADELRLTLLDGLGMFVAQAGHQFTAWTGRPAPLRLFDRICRDALGG